MREFAISTGGATVAGASTLLFINPAGAPNPNIEMLRTWIGQSANATSAQQRMQHVTQASAFPTLTSATPSKRKLADPNASIIVGGTAGAVGTSGINASVEGAGTKTAVWDDCFNVLNGHLWIPTPPEMLLLPAGYAQGFGLFFPVAPLTLTNWAWGGVFREI
jgi:hypothetical protein